MGRIARTVSVLAYSSTSDFSRSARRRKFSNSACRRSRRSVRSLFSSARRSRSAATDSSVDAGEGGSAPSMESTMGSFGFMIPVYKVRGEWAFPKKLNRQIPEGLAHVKDGGHRFAVVHAHGAKDGDLR